MPASSRLCEGEPQYAIGTLDALFCNRIATLLQISAVVSQFVSHDFEFVGILVLLLSYWV